MAMKMTVYVYTAELERMRAFYEAAFGVRPADHGDWQPFALGGGTFALHALSDAAGQNAQRFNVSFEVEDIETAVGRFEQAGANVLRGVADEAFGRRALLEDPEGRTFEVMQPEVG